MNSATAAVIFARRPERSRSAEGATPVANRSLGAEVPDANGSLRFSGSARAGSLPAGSQHVSNDPTADSVGLSPTGYGVPGAAQRQPSTRPIAGTPSR